MPFGLIIFTLLAVLSVGSHAAPLPQSAVLHYVGSYGIPATMTFTRNHQRYKITLELPIPLYPIYFESSGNIVGSLLKPTYYRDVRGGKVYAEAKFSQGKVTYGKTGEQKTENTSSTILDLFALSWQLAATDGSLPAGIKITNGKRIYNVSGLNKVGSSSFSFSGGKTTINQYRMRRGDDTVNYAFAPAFGNIPAQIHYTDDGKTYQLKLNALTLNGQSVKP